MEHRLNYSKAAPIGYRALGAVDAYLEDCGLDLMLLTLIQMRASMINGCAYCIDMHSKDLRAMGESEQRIHGLSAWRETPYYTDRERVALRWTEEITLISVGHAPADAYAEVCQHFSEEEVANLTLAIAAINSWNRVCISFRAEPGTYKSTRTPLVVREG